MIMNSCCFMKLHWSQSPFTFFAKWSQFSYKSVATNAWDVNSQILCCCCCFSLYFRGCTLVDRWPSPYFYSNDCQFGSSVWVIYQVWFLISLRVSAAVLHGRWECASCSVPQDPSNPGAVVPNELPMRNAEKFHQQITKNVLLLRKIFILMKWIAAGKLFNGGEISGISN